MNAAELHENSIIIDGLNASWFLDDDVIKHIHAGGITAVNATIAAWHSPDETIDMIGRVLEQLDKHADIALQVKKTKDITEAKASGRTGFILGFQDTAPIADRLHLLRVYRDLGVRIIQLTYNFENLVGFGCQAPEDKGLTSYGREMISEMNRLGILIDLSHCGVRTTIEAIELSALPAAITHSNSADLFPHPRNKSDAIIKACTEKGGVIGAVAFPAMVKQNLPATLGDYIDTISYLAEQAGVDHVGLGPDFMEAMPLEVIKTVLRGLPPDVLKFMKDMPPMDGFSSAAETANVTAHLIESMFDPEDVRKIIGGNWLRLYETVWHDLSI
ncbi:MAG: peptidase M19 [Spirochaetales bacterium]|jgi:membrane dipeptidase|nr:peptidase M19 [Spirochaetales bacterium]